jgi:hypothetical protein
MNSSQLRLLVPRVKTFLSTGMILYKEKSLVAGYWLRVNACFESRVLGF